jgi:tol-pal system protein YbgF
MIILRRNPLFAIIFAVCLLALGSCRTSQRESRGATRNAGGSSPAVSRQMDSLLMIEQKLTEVIDSMASLVDADHSRIRTLEEQVQALQNQSQSSGARPPMPPNDPRPSNNSYLTAPPPSIPPSAPPSTPPNAPPAAAPSIPSGAASNSYQQRYTTALSLYNDNNFEAALDQFKSLENDDTNGPYASNYKYWEGECYYGEKRYNKALETFGTVLEQYPNSTKVAATLFKTGECYERLNDTENARAAYERVIADYPNSEYHARALARLKALSH